MANTMWDWISSGRASVPASPALRPRQPDVPGHPQTEHRGNLKFCCESPKNKAGLGRASVPASRCSTGEPDVPGQRMRIDPTAEYEKWLQFDTRLIFTNCGALTWYLRKAWLLDNAPELMPPSDPAEAFDIRRSVRSRLAKADYFSHIRIRARLAFADRLLHERRTVYHSQPTAGMCWQE